MIDFRNVDKFYNVRGSAKTILDNATFTIPAKNIGILGINGAGKSTLMRLIAGIEMPNSGMIHKHVSTSWPLGFRGSFNGSLTGLENVRFVARIYGQDTEYIEDFVLDFSELGDFFYAPVRTYSSGMKARLAFGLSMAIDFQCYLVDEITEVGDKRFRKRSNLTFKQKMKTSNIIMISHNDNTLRSYCQEGIVLHNGQMSYYDELEEAIEVHKHNMKNM